MATFDANSSAPVASSNGNPTYAVTKSAETPFPVTSPTYEYVMIGFDTISVLVPTVWTVTGTPDSTGAFSGNPTINAATIRILETHLL